jgi:hypothetical protein
MQESNHANRIARLEATVDKLVAELERLQQGRTRSMAESGRCPACGTTPVLHFRRVMEATRNGLVDLALRKERSFWGVIGEGPLEAFLCRGCRLVEWRASSLDGLEPDGDVVVERAAVDTARPKPAPYR